MSWTREEKDLLIDLYCTHSDRELCAILKKTPGQLRGMKERLGLRSKLNTFTDSEIQAIVNWYIQFPDEMNLDLLASKLSRPKTSISRVARRLGLTNQSRHLSDESVIKMQESHKRYMESDVYRNEIYPKQVELLSFYSKNNHPRGMLGKHHTTEARRSMSKTHALLYANMDESKRAELTARQVRGRRIKSPCKSTSNTYSRCRGGMRNDLGQYFRSSWEANFARVLNHTNLEWQYEPRQFFFPDGCSVLSYRPDFYIPSLDMWVEIKGWMDDKSKSRLKYFQIYYPEESRNLAVIGEHEYRIIERHFKNVIVSWESKKN